MDEVASEVDRLEYLCETESGTEKVMAFVVLWKASCTQSWDARVSPIALINPNENHAVG